MSVLGNAIPAWETAAYLRTLPAIRERCGRVHDLAKEGKLQYFDYHPDKEEDVAKFCIDLMKVEISLAARRLTRSEECISATTETTLPAYVYVIQHATRHSVC